MFKPLLTFFIFFLLHASGYCTDEQIVRRSFVCIPTSTMSEQPGSVQHVSAFAAGYYMPEFSLPQAEIANHPKRELSVSPFLPEGDRESESSRSQGLSSKAWWREALPISKSLLENTLLTLANQSQSAEAIGGNVFGSQEGSACVRCGLTLLLLARPSPQPEGILHVETLIHIAASYCAYYPQGKPPEKCTFADSYMSPDFLLKSRGFQPDLELSTEEVTVFVHPGTKKVIIAYKGTSDLFSACASVGSCINWKAENYDKAGESMPIAGWFEKPYTKIMNSALLTSFLSWSFYFQGQFFPNFKLPFGNNTFFVCMGIFSTAVFLAMSYNFMPKLFFHCFSNSYIALDPIVENVRQKYGNNITLTGHSLGGIRAQISCAQHGFETFTFCAPGGGYELTIDTIKKHPKKSIKLLPWNDFAKRIHAFSVNGDLIPTLKKGVDVKHQECGIPNNGVSAPHAIETMWEMYLRKMNHEALKEQFRI